VATILFKLIAPEKVLFSGDVRTVMVPATEGDMTVMAERTLPPEELTKERLDEEIMRLDTMRDATRDHRAHREADFAPSRLEQVRTTLSF
jgi:F-type H+-transporting ATPase subunit epsilon